jgi:hypothetical protein
MAIRRVQVADGAEQGDPLDRRPPMPINMPVVKGMASSTAPQSRGPAPPALCPANREASAMAEGTGPAFY